MSITGQQLYKEWRESGLSKREIGEQHDLTYGQAAGKIWRYEQERKKEQLASFGDYYKPTGAPFALQLDNFIAAADVQIPTTDELWVDLLCMTAQKHLKRPRTLILGGDLLNMDAFSRYDKDTDEASLTDEVEAARGFFRQIIRHFDNVYWFWGNHERRATRRTSNILTPYLVGQMILGSILYENKVHLSHWGYMFLETSRERWIIAHGKNYSVQQLNVAEWLSWKYQMNVISFHEHHLGHGYDRFKHFQIINGGGLFKQSEMAFVVLDASKMPNMQNGFVLFKDSYPYVMGPDGYTNWADWLPDGVATEQKLRLAA